jgi:hypothetical protein
MCNIFNLQFKFFHVVELCSFLFISKHFSQNLRNAYTSTLFNCYLNMLHRFRQIFFVRIICHHMSSKNYSFQSIFHGFGEFFHVLSCWFLLFIRITWIAPNHFWVCFWGNIFKSIFQYFFNLKKLYSISRFM